MANQSRLFGMRGGGGVPGAGTAVLIAAYIVKSLPLDALRWLVVVVASYTALVMLRSALVTEGLPGEPNDQPGGCSRLVP